MKVSDLVKPLPRHYSSAYGYTTEDTTNHGIGIIIECFERDDYLYFKVKWQHDDIEWWREDDLYLLSKGESP